MQHRIAIPSWVGHVLSLSVVSMMVVYLAVGGRGLELDRVALALTVVVSTIATIFLRLDRDRWKQKAAR